MKHVLAFDQLFENSNSSIDVLLPLYLDSKKELVELGKVNGIRVISVNRDLISPQFPEWKKYLGSHHWGKKTSYIPEDAIWVAQSLAPEEFIRVVNHELIEREAMRALQSKGMSTEESWEIAHPWVKSLGF